MDLEARHKLWSVLQNFKKDRIIILTTHNMDEAEILGSRIGIMQKGSLVALGSPQELKSSLKVTGTLEDVFMKYCEEETIFSEK
jgi:ABC-type multidrug transport system ATPase subunit